MQNSQSQQVKTKIQESDYSDAQNISSYSHSEYLERRKEKPKNSQVCDIVEGKWSEDEKIKYVLFVYHHFKVFKSKMKRKQRFQVYRRNLRVFKTLSEYLGSRTPRQCRSHFQKLMNRFKNIKKMIEHHQKELGMNEFIEAHLKQVKQIQCYPLQNQVSQKPTVACQDQACQTQNLDITKDYEGALLKIKLLEQLLLETNIRLSQSRNHIFPFQNCFPFQQY